MDRALNGKGVDYSDNATTMVNIAGVLNRLLSYELQCILPSTDVDLGLTTAVDPE